MTVALGLALLVLMPLPFMRAMGLGGLLVPLVSIAAAATFLPALLAVMGRRVNRFRFMPRSVLDEARARPRAALGAARPLDHAPPGPVLRRHGGASCSRWRYPAPQLTSPVATTAACRAAREAVDGLKVLERTLGPGRARAEPGRGRHGPRGTASGRRSRWRRSGG